VFQGSGSRLWMATSNDTLGRGMATLYVLGESVENIMGKDKDGDEDSDQISRQSRTSEMCV